MVKWVKITTDMFDNRKIRHLRRLPEDTRTEKEIEFDRVFEELKARFGIESEGKE